MANRSNAACWMAGARIQRHLPYLGGVLVDMAWSTKLGAAIAAARDPDTVHSTGLGISGLGCHIRRAALAALGGNRREFYHSDLGRTAKPGERGDAHPTAGRGE